MCTGRDTAACFTMMVCRFVRKLEQEEEEERRDTATYAIRGCSSFWEKARAGEGGRDVQQRRFCVLID